MELRERISSGNDEGLDEQQKSLIKYIDSTIEPKKKKYKTISESTRKKLLHLTKEMGLSIKKVAKKLRINYSTAKCICRAYKKEMSLQKSPAIPSRETLDTEESKETVTGKVAPEEKPQVKGLPVPPKIQTNQMKLEEALPSQNLHMPLPMAWPDQYQALLSKQNLYQQFDGPNQMKMNKLDLLAHSQALNYLQGLNNQSYLSQPEFPTSVNRLELSSTLLSLANPSLTGGLPLQMPNLYKQQVPLFPQQQQMPLSNGDLLQRLNMNTPRKLTNLNFMMNPPAPSQIGTMPMNSQSVLGNMAQLNLLNALSQRTLGNSISSNWKF